MTNEYVLEVLRKALQLHAADNARMVRMGATWDQRRTMDAEYAQHKIALNIVATAMAGPMFDGDTVAKTKHTSPEMSTLASQMMTQTRAKLQVERERGEPIIVAQAYLKRVLKLCGCVLSQDETKGQGDLAAAMTEQPKWMSDLPVSVDPRWGDERYRK